VDLAIYYPHIRVSRSYAIGYNARRINRDEDLSRFPTRSPEFEREGLWNATPEPSLMEVLPNDESRLRLSRSGMNVIDGQWSRIGCLPKAKHFS
jgi:hypothetical protein